MDSGDPSCGSDAIAFIFAARHAGISGMSCALLLAEHASNKIIKMVVDIGFIIFFL